MKIKPCPWCGEEAILKQTKSKLYYITCDNYDCSIYPMMYEKFDTEQEAIEAWNKRKGEKNV